MDDSAGLIKAVFGIIVVVLAFFAFKYGFDAGQSAGKAWRSTAPEKAKR
jgi:hypothetical protein